MINWSKVTGAQILSILLGVIEFITVPITKKATRNHIAIFEKENKLGKAKVDLDNIIIIKKTNKKEFKIATSLIFTGYLPLNFPPIDAAPQGRPAARHNWNKITSDVNTINA